MNCPTCEQKMILYIPPNNKKRLYWCKKCKKGLLPTKCPACDEELKVHLSKDGKIKRYFCYTCQRFLTEEVLRRKTRKRNRVSKKTKFKVLKIIEYRDKGIRFKDIGKMLDMSKQAVNELYLKFKDCEELL